ncbi:unnamed protein product, partial [Mesorhabditis belari]|uniref:non-specific serine/threonine protein kinase n=1 Tax=Mesorhabditis belari TaxID=2138241 RepID=A0AAF3F440_9BILA
MSSYDSGSRNRQISLSLSRKDSRQRVKMGLGYGQNGSRNWDFSSSGDQLQRFHSTPQIADNHAIARSHQMTKTLDTYVEEYEMAPVVNWPVKQPKSLKGYLFGPEIGVGSYAKVKEVIQDKTLIRCAVKIFKDCRLRKIPNGFSNVLNEYYLLRQLEHPNCVKMIEFFRIEEKYKQYMILEYCIASLEKVVALSTGRKLSEAWSNFFFRQLISGVDYIHSLGIIHKDIKPANLLISSNRVLKITDFGVAEQVALFQRDTITDTLQGTPKFHPPEVVNGKNEFYDGFALDVWASGITLYYLLSGEYPFGGTTMRQLFTNICERPLLMPNTVDLRDELVDLLAGMLDKKPKRRLKVHEVVHHPWFVHLFPQTDMNWDQLVNECYSGLAVPVYSQLNVLFGGPEDVMIETPVRNQALLKSTLLKCEEKTSPISEKTIDASGEKERKTKSRAESRLHKFTRWIPFLSCLRNSN